MNRFVIDALIDRMQHEALLAKFKELAVDDTTTVTEAVAEAGAI